MKRWHFYDKVYRIWVEVCIGNSEELYEELDNIGYKFIQEIRDDIPKKGYMLRIKPGDCTTQTNMTIIWMEKYSADTVVHELMHLVTRTFDDKGIPCDDNNTEAMAFYMEYWYHEIMNTRKRYPNGRPPKLAKT